ncbi:hypothetical protein BDV10DRAFT_158213 [Aspergillus recurvatus]
MLRYAWMVSILLCSSKVAIRKGTVKRCGCVDKWLSVSRWDLHPGTILSSSSTVQIRSNKHLTQLSEQVIACTCISWLPGSGILGNYITVAYVSFDEAKRICTGAVVQVIRISAVTPAALRWSNNSKPAFPSAVLWVTYCPQAVDRHYY